MNRREYVLVKAIEECNELAQALSKVLTFGEDSDFNGQLPLTNRQHAIVELNDLIAVLKAAGLCVFDESKQQAKIEKMEFFMHRSVHANTLQK